MSNEYEMEVLKISTITEVAKEALKEVLVRIVTGKHTSI